MQTRFITCETCGGSGAQGFYLARYTALEPNNSAEPCDVCHGRREIEICIECEEPPEYCVCAVEVAA